MSLTFNSSITYGSFLLIWKLAMVRPLPKTSSVTSATDFRPISILPALSKALENIVKDQIHSYLTDNKLLEPLQSGFRPNHSTNTALVHVTEDFRWAKEHRQATILVLLDYSKALQSVDYDILLTKLKAFFNFSESAISWIRY